MDADGSSREGRSDVRVVIGHAIDNDDMHWVVACPACDAQHTFEGYFDPQDIDECRCGCVFRTERVMFDDGSFIQ